MKKIFLTLMAFSSFSLARTLTASEMDLLGNSAFSIGVKCAFVLFILFILFSLIFIIIQKIAGFNVKLPWPFVNSKMNLQIRELKSTIGSRTKDESFLKIPITTQFRIINTNSSIKDAFYELDDAEEQMLLSYINNIASAKINELTVKEFYSSKGEFEDTIKETLTYEFKKFGFEIVNVLVDDPILSDELIDASHRAFAADLKVKLFGKN